MRKRIGFVSTRFSVTDGVTLEAAKWAEVLEENGHRCYWFAGKLAEGAERRSLLVPEAFFRQLVALFELLFFDLVAADLFAVLPQCDDQAGAREAAVVRTSRSRSWNGFGSGITGAAGAAAAVPTGCARAAVPTGCARPAAASTSSATAPSLVVTGGRVNGANWEAASELPA